MGHGKETPRQKMIGMMYLVLTAMLALNVSKDILDAFVLVDNGLFKTTENFASKNQTLYSEFDKQMANNPEKIGPWQNKALEVRAAADLLVLDIQKLKVEIVKHCDGDDAEALTSSKRNVFDLTSKTIKEEDSYEINDALISAKDNLDKPAELMIVNGKGAELKKKIEDFRTLALSYTSDKHPEIKTSLEKSLNTDPPPVSKDGIQQTWESNYFEHIPMVAVLTMLTKLQSDVRNSEAEIVGHLLTEIDAGAVKVNKVEAIVKAKSNYILRGSEYEAQVILAAYDSLQKPEIMIGPFTTKRLPDGSVDYEMTGQYQTLTYDADGKAIYRRAGSSPGMFPWGGILQLTNPDGSKLKRPFTAEYQVGEPSAAVSPTKMNVFYLGVENPVSISVSGVPADKISVSMTNGNITRSGGGYIVKPTAVGTARVNVSANVDGRSSSMGSFEFRVKRVPDPVAKVDGKSGGNITKARLMAQLAVLADMDQFDFDLKFRITGFTVTASGRGGFENAPKKSTSGNITSEQKDLINTAARGAKVLFENITALGPDGSTRNLNSIVFTID